MERTGIDNLIAHWNTTLHDVGLRPSAFYEMVEQEISMRRFAGMRLTSVYWREGGWFSARREYLRIVWRQLVFDICGFPLGDSFSVSWWLGTNEQSVRNLFLEIPLLGSLIEAGLSPATYYEVDSESVFQNGIHNSVLRVIDVLTDQNHLPRLDELAREPIMAEFYG